MKQLITVGLGLTLPLALALALDTVFQDDYPAVMAVDSQHVKITGHKSGALILNLLELDFLRRWVVAVTYNVK